MELTLVGLQYSGKTTFVNVIAVSMQIKNRTEKDPLILCLAYGLRLVGYDYFAQFVVCS